MGHGAHLPEDGFVSVPKGFSVRFYTNHMKALPTAYLTPILKGEREPSRTFAEYRLCPNYTWQNGNPSNYQAFVGPADENLPPELRQVTWDVRYVQFFKAGGTGALATQAQAAAKFTFKDLLEGDDSGCAHPYFDNKSRPVEVHVLLCSVVQLNSGLLGKEAGVNAGEYSDKYVHKKGTHQRVISRPALGETASGNYREFDEASRIARGESKLPLSDFARAIKCARCGTPFRRPAKFCTHCGQRRFP